MRSFLTLPLPSTLFFALSLALFWSTSCTKHHLRPSHQNHHHRFDDAAKWAKVFEKESRNEWQKPAQVIKALHLADDALVTDIGAGTGYFPVRIAKHIPKGKVYAADIESNLIRFLKERKKKENLSNFYPILGEANDPLIPELMDVIMMVDTYHHISQRSSYFSKLKKDLKEDGRLVIIDFKKEDLPVGPPKKMKISKAQVVEELKSAGYRLEREEGFLPYQYMLVFQKLTPIDGVQ